MTYSGSLNREGLITWEVDLVLGTVVLETTWSLPCGRLGTSQEEGSVLVELGLGTLTNVLVRLEQALHCCQTFVFLN